MTPYERLLLLTLARLCNEGRGQLGNDIRTLSEHIEREGALPKPKPPDAPEKRYYRTLVTGYSRLCSECGERLPIGDEFVFDSEERRPFCLACGEDLQN